ncbi:MAG: hypothetical protein JXA71_06135 [Chitinispirillaceae bacterium]|nr:hypothetical protein [Chitinispirillaceae bacterium]
MRHARFETLVLFSALLLCFSCASRLKQKFIDEPYRSGSLSVPLMVTDIEVADERKSVAIQNLAAPTATLKKKGDTIMEPLTIEQEKAIHDEIRQCIKGEGVRVRIRATLKDGVKQYSSGFFNAREYARTAVTIELLDEVTQPYFFSTTGEAHYEVKSTKADTAFLETLYRKALKTSVYKAFESIEEFLRKQAPSSGSDG